MHTHYAIKLLAFLTLTLGITGAPVCNINTNNTASSDILPAPDIPQILARKKLVALTDNSSTSYFIYKGEPMGYEYEMLRAFARHLDVELQVIVAKDMNNIFDQLQKGQVDIVCANLTVTEDRLKKVNFTEPLIYTRQVLVQRKPEGWQKMSDDRMNRELVRSTIDMAAKDIYVRKESSFYARLRNLQDEIAAPIGIIEVPGDVTTEGLIAMVASGKIAYTIADENVAMVNQTYYPRLDIKTAISFPQKIAWAVNKGAPLLLAELDNWIVQHKTTSDHAVIYNKYFKSPKAAEQRNESKYSSLGGNKISPYDDMIQAYSREIDWDWRLLASMIYQESKFNPNAQSWAGACGLMQMIPETAQQYGLDTCGGTPIQSIDAGTQHIIKLDRYWAKHINDKNERIKFVLASYNAGLGHVIDARNLCKKYGKHPDRWDGNVERYLLLKSYPKYYNDPVVHCGYCRGQEPYKYVREILTRFDHYKNTIKDIDEKQELADANI